RSVLNRTIPCKPRPASSIRSKLSRSCIYGAHRERFSTLRAASGGGDLEPVFPARRKRSGAPRVAENDFERRRGGGEACLEPLAHRRKALLAREAGAPLCEAVAGTGR